MIFVLPPHPSLAIQHLMAWGVQRSSPGEPRRKTILPSIRYDNCSQRSGYSVELPINLLLRSLFCFGEVAGMSEWLEYTTSMQKKSMVVAKRAFDTTLLLRSNSVRLYGYLFVIPGWWDPCDYAARSLVAGSTRQWPRRMVPEILCQGDTERVRQSGLICFILLIRTPNPKGKSQRPFEDEYHIVWRNWILNPLLAVTFVVW